MSTLLFFAAALIATFVLSWLLRLFAARFGMDLPKFFALGTSTFAVAAAMYLVGRNALYTPVVILAFLILVLGVAVPVAVFKNLRAEDV